MADPELIELLKVGPSAWNAWRRRERPNHIDLTKASLGRADLGEANLRAVDLGGADLTAADLTRADLRGAFLGGAVLDGAGLEGANLKQAVLIRARGHNANFRLASFRRANLWRAGLKGADLTQADLRGANLHQTDFTEARLESVDFTSSQMVETVLVASRLERCRIYGVAAWNLQTARAVQRDLIVTEESHPVVTVDDIEVAQFLHLLLNNRHLRGVIDTITSRLVLILGRFTEERKRVLEAIRDEVREQGLLPVIFDGEKPVTRNLTETVSILAHLARYIIADITDPRSVPHELATIVPGLPSVKVQPIVEAGHQTYSMFEHLLNYPWVLPPLPYRGELELAETLRARLETLR